jgi:hypothetical protein
MTPTILQNHQPFIGAAAFNASVPARAARTSHSNLQLLSMPLPAAVALERHRAFTKGVFASQCTGSTYTQQRGYAYDWGHVLDADQEQGIRFVPTDLVGRGAPVELLQAVAADWFEQRAPAFAGHVSLAAGPDYAPLTLQGHHAASMEWVTKVFIPEHFGDLIRRWVEAARGTPASLPQGQAGGGSTTTEKMPVFAIFQQPHGGTNSLQLILMAAEGSPRMNFITWTAGDGMLSSGWIELPSARAGYAPPATDFILDFYRDNGFTVVDTLVTLENEGIGSLIHQLLERRLTQQRPDTEMLE